MVGAQALPVAHGTSPLAPSSVRIGSVDRDAQAVGRQREAVLGAQVSRDIGMVMGDSFIGSHGLGGGGHEHGENTFRVTGVLAPCGCVLDRLILTSTPNGRRGSFWYFYQTAMRQPNWLALRIPTWEAYPNITEAQLEEIWRADPIRFEGDFGANFVDPALLPQPVMMTPNRWRDSPPVALPVREEVPLPPPRSRYQILLEELEQLQQVESVGLSSVPSDAELT